MSIRVECHAGYRGEEYPRRFYLGERRVEATEILDRWLDPEYRYFKLRGDDDGVYILRHSVAENSWEMTLYNGGGCKQTRLSST